MAKQRGRKNATKQPDHDVDDDGMSYLHHEVERQKAAIRALRDVEVEQLHTMLRLLRSHFSKEQCQVPLLQFFKENLQNLSILETGNDGQYEVQWKDKDGNVSMIHTDDNTIDASLLHRLSLAAYPAYSADIASFGGFELSNKSVRTTFLGADKLQIRSLVLEEDSQMPESKDGLQTPDESNNRLSVGMTPKTRRLPKNGEVLLSVHGSPLGVYKEDNMETIQEAEDG